MASQDLKIDESSGILSVSQAINYLGLQLYRKLAKEKENTFFSPLSLSSALSMVFCGSKSDTAKEMRRILGYERANIADKDVSRCFEILLSALDKTPDSYSLKNANAVFSQRDFLIKDEFKNLLQESFKAMTLDVDFVNESTKAVQQANDWVKDKTNGMIPQLLDSLDPASVMVILNAVYFKGFWMEPFQQESTYQQNFYNKGSKSKAKMVEMMHLEESFPFLEKSSLKALRLPYKGEEIAMVILLPKKRNGLEALEKRLSSDFITSITAKVIADITAQMVARKVKVALPKFRLEYSKSMKQYFQKLGMKSAFCRGANFEGISDTEDLHVSEIVHKAVLVVNEEGSEAAAATGVAYVETCLREDPDFIVDHPFMFLIYNTITNLILFMGRVDEL